MKDNKRKPISFKDIDNLLVLHKVLFGRDELSKYQKPLSIATYCHEGQVDRGGENYINHLVAVKELAVQSPLIQSENQKDVVFQAALLHDILEDTNFTKEMLYHYFDKEVADAVVLLTKQGKGVQNESENYFKAIKSNPVARIVKIADLTHNITLSRLSTIKQKDIERTKRYLDHLSYLLQDE